MQRERLELKIVMEDGPDPRGIGPGSALDIAGSAYMASIAKHPDRNVQLRHGVRIIERHDGAPRFRRWSSETRTSRAGLYI
jgi:hypothetical protein